MNAKIAAFIDGLISYDYILFIGSFVFFILFIILTILLRKKITLALLFLFLGFTTLFLGPTVGYVKMHKYLFKNSVILESQKKLSFTETVVVKGRVINESNYDFKNCKVTASAYKVTKNEYKNFLLKLKPFKKRSMLTTEIPKGGSYDFKLFIEPFTYSKEYNISLEADCQ
ncbi:MAG: DUF2393 family protein [Campylobacterales bacterium]|nr:DUF2393 family protein [Campylobacterales bacterium]